MVIVGLAVAVPDSGVISATSSGLLDCRTRKTTAAARVMSNANSPKAAGRLRVNSGNLLARTPLDFLVFFTESKSVPQTRHLVADSLMRVPQTGQSFVFEVFVSWLILILG
jgi:hypothetical protein